MPQLYTFSVLSITHHQNTRDFGTGIPKTQGYSNHCDHWLCMLPTITQALTSAFSNVKSVGVDGGDTSTQDGGYSDGSSLY